MKKRHQSILGSRLQHTMIEVSCLWLLIPMIPSVQTFSSAISSAFFYSHSKFIIFLFFHLSPRGFILPDFIHFHFHFPLHFPFISDHVHVVVVFFFFMFFFACFFHSSAFQPQFQFSVSFSFCFFLLVDHPHAFCFLPSAFCIFAFFVFHSTLFHTFTFHSTLHYILLNYTSLHHVCTFMLINSF